MKHIVVTFVHEGLGWTLADQSLDGSVIPNFTLAGWTISMKHIVVTFVHEGLGWTLADQSLDGSVEWLCVDVDGIKIVNVYKPPTSRMIPSQCSHTPVST